MDAAASQKRVRKRKRIGEDSTASAERWRHLLKMVAHTRYLAVCTLLLGLLSVVLLLRSQDNSEYYGLRANTLTDSDLLNVEYAQPDAFVLIAMPPVEINMALWSVKNLVDNGKWNGNVFVITSYDASHPCLSETQFLDHYPNVRLIDPTKAFDNVQPKHIKSLLFKLLPENVQSVLYMDTDILVTSKLESSDLFRRTIPVVLDSMQRGNTHLGLFYDAKGHTFGFCSGCQIYHTGVVLMHRVASEDILREWLRTKIDDGYPKDQQALQALLARDHTYRIDIFPYKYIAFMKDIPRSLFLKYISGRSPLFAHFIGLTRAPSGTISSGILSRVLGYAQAKSDIASMCPIS